jgi:hypothetical protein
VIADPFVRSWGMLIGSNASNALKETDTTFETLCRVSAPGSSLPSPGSGTIAWAKALRKMLLGHLR